MQGYIKIYRKIRENPIFNDMELFRLWIICLTEATHKGRTQIVGRQTVDLLPGQFVTGRFDIQGLYNRGLTGEQQKSPATVWRWMEVLKNGDFIDIKSSNKFSVISISNWDKYQNGEQQNEQQVSNKRATDEQQVSTNKNVYNNLSSVDEYTGNPFSEIENYFIMKRGKGLVISSDDVDAVNELLAYGIPTDSIKKSIDNVFKEYKPKHPRDKITTFSYCAARCYEDWNLQLSKQKAGDNGGAAKESVRQGLAPVDDKPITGKSGVLPSKWFDPATGDVPLSKVSG